MSCTSCNDNPDFSLENVTLNGCPFQIPGNCIFYTGNPIPVLGIRKGDSFDTVVQKLAYLYGTPTTSTSSTTTTSTTSSTSSSTTTTTTTTTQALDVIYLGAKSTSGFPISSEIGAGTISSQNSTNNVVANWTSYTTPSYLWIAIPASHAKTKWQDSVNTLNQGSIGTSNDLFGTPSPIAINNIDYLIYMTNYPTTFTYNVLLKAS